jgi:hypothetical protein
VTLSPGHALHQIFTDTACHLGYVKALDRRLVAMVDVHEKLLQRIDALPADVVKAALASWVRQSDSNFTPLQKALDEQEELVRAHDSLVETPEFLEAFPGQTEEEITAECDQRWQEFTQTGHAIDHAEVEKWLDSIGTDKPLPCPQ